MKPRTFLAFGLYLFTTVGLSTSAWGQLDTALLRPSTDGPTPQSLDGSRYKLRPATPRRTPMPTPAPTSTPAATPAITPVLQEPEMSPAPTAPPTTPLQTPLPTPASAQPQTSKIEIGFAPTYYYDSSTSNYSFRNYHTGGPGYSLEANVWLSQMVGLHSQYFSSLSGSVNDGSINAVSMLTQDLKVGLRLRSHFGSQSGSGLGADHEAMQITCGLDYQEASDGISGRAQTLLGHKTSGLSLNMQMDAASGSKEYSHLFEIELRPLQHTSESRSALGLSSGTNAEVDAVALSIGGQWKLESNYRVFWKTEYRVEHELFSGSASKIDPKTLNTPQGVGVTNSSTILYFGLKWGS